MEEKIDFLVEKIDVLSNEVKKTNEKVDSLVNEMKEVKGRLDVVENRLDSQGKKIDENSEKIEDLRIDLTKEINRVSSRLEQKIDGFREINTREHSVITEHFEDLYQESKQDRRELHQNVNDLSNAYKMNRMDIDRIMAKC